MCPDPSLVHVLVLRMPADIPQCHLFELTHFFGVLVNILYTENEYAGRAVRVKNRRWSGLTLRILYFHVFQIRKFASTERARDLLSKARSRVMIEDFPVVCCHCIR